MMRSQCLLGLFIYLLWRQICTVIQYQTVRYATIPLSPVSQNQLFEEEDSGAGSG
uniref:Uncharacterized protein n=1 Tax=Saimiri boliviensis boliviensis TaxID=39432 RepID=A0A2K6UDT6_SAIBB